MTKEKAGRITKQTLVPVALVIVLMKGSSWLTTTHDKTEFQEKQIVAFESKLTQFSGEQVKMMLDLQELKGDVKGIKGAIERIESLTSSLPSPKLGRISAWRHEK